MTTLSEKFSTLESDLSDQSSEAHSQRESILTTLSDIQSGLASINSDMLLMKQSLLAAVGQNNPCVTCPPPSLITPTTSPTSNPIDEDKCKRVQAFIHAVHEITGVFGAATDSGIFWNPSIVTSGISEVITTLVTGGTVPLPSFGESVNIAGDAINYGLSNIGRGDNLQAQFDSVSSGMRDTLYIANSPADVQSAYEASINSSSLPNDEKLLFNALGFNDLFSYYFDPASTPDLTGYDGTICSFPSGTCFTVGPTASSSDGGSSTTALGSTFGPFAPVSGAIGSSSGPVVWTPPIFYGVDPFGWTFECLVGHVFLLHRAGGISDTGTFTVDTTFGVDGTPHAFPHAGTWTLGIDVGGSIRICKA